MKYKDYEANLHKHDSSCILSFILHAHAFIFKMGNQTEGWNVSLFIFYLSTVRYPQAAHSYTGSHKYLSYSLGPLEVFWPNLPAQSRVNTHSAGLGIINQVPNYGDVFKDPLSFD